MENTETMSKLRQWLDDKEAGACQSCTIAIIEHLGDILGAAEDEPEEYSTWVKCSSED